MSSEAISRIAHIKNALKMNGYPKSFIIHTARRSSVKDKQEIEEKPKATVILPYVGVSESIKRMLEKVSIRVRMRPHRTLTCRQLLVKPKDPTPNYQQTGIVYRVP